MRKFLFTFIIMALFMGINAFASEIPDFVNIGINNSSLASSVKLYSDAGVYTDSSFAKAEGSTSAYHYIADEVLVSVGEDGTLICNEFVTGKTSIDFFRTSEFIYCQNKPYRGAIRLRVKSGKILIINMLNMDDYLYGVLGKEMSESFPLEALKAQSVAARNYAILNMGRHSSDGFNLCNGQHCQAYGGANSEGEKIRQAVDETTGKLLYYNGEIVSCYYYSSNGGYSESSENVWVASLGYVRGKPDPFEDPSRIPGYYWQKTFTAEQIKKTLAARGIDIGDIVDVEVRKVSENKHVTELVFVGTNGEKKYTKDNIRAALPESLKSTLFTVEKGGDGASARVLTGNGMEVRNVGEAYVMSGDGKVKLSGSGNEGEFVFSGSGYGHGVGLSQYGAYFMAEQGYTYKEILKFYYTDTEIK